MFLVQNSTGFLGNDKNGRPSVVSSQSKAIKFLNEQKANNFIENLPYLLSEDCIGEKWNIMNDDVKKNNDECEVFSDICDGLNIEDFLEQALPVLSNLPNFAAYNRNKERDINDEILDIRHYLRDKKGKINAVQMQRIGYYLQSLEIKRENAKKSYIVTEMITKNYDVLQDKKFTDEVKSVFHTPYKPRKLSYEEIDAICKNKKKRY